MLASLPGLSIGTKRDPLVQAQPNPTGAFSLHTNTATATDVASHTQSTNVSYPHPPSTDSASSGLKIFREHFRFCTKHVQIFLSCHYP